MLHLMQHSCIIAVAVRFCLCWKGINFSHQSRYHSTKLPNQTNTKKKTNLPNKEVKFNWKQILTAALPPTRILPGLQSWNKLIVSLNIWIFMACITVRCTTLVSCKWMLVEYQSRIFFNTVWNTLLTLEASKSNSGKSTSPPLVHNLNLQQFFFLWKATACVLHVPRRKSRRQIILCRGFPQNKHMTSW